MTRGTFKQDPSTEHGPQVHRGRFITLTVAAVLAATAAVPALAQSHQTLTGLDRARQATMQALERAANPDEKPSAGQPPGAVPPDESDDGKSDDGKSNSGKSNNGKDKSKKDKSDKGKSGNGNSGNGKSDNGNSGNGNAKNDKDDKPTGQERAAAAIAKAMERGDGNGHSAAVLDMLLQGQAPASLEGQVAHSSEVTAMVEAYNELRRRQSDAG